MICTFCSKEVVNASVFLRHVSVFHRSDPNFFLSCGIDRCQVTFRRYSSFTSHIYRKHQDALWNKAPNTTENVFHGRNGKKCVYCEQKINTKRSLSSHVISHISNGIKVDCPFKFCEKKYDNAHSFTSHLTRSHRSASLDNLKEIYGMCGYWMNFNNSLRCCTPKSTLIQGSHV